MWMFICLGYIGIYVGLPGLGVELRSSSLTLPPSQAQTSSISPSLSKNALSPPPACPPTTLSIPRVTWHNLTFVLAQSRVYNVSPDSWPFQSLSYLGREMQSGHEGISFLLWLMLEKHAHLGSPASCSLALPCQTGEDNLSHTFITPYCVELCLSGHLRLKPEIFQSWGWDYELSHPVGSPLHEYQNTSHLPASDQQRDTLCWLDSSFLL